MTELAAYINDLFMEDHYLFMEDSFPSTANIIE